MHDCCTRNHRRKRLLDLVADVEDHVHVNGPWQYKLSDLYYEPAVTAAVEQHRRGGTNHGGRVSVPISCGPDLDAAGRSTRRDLLTELRQELPAAIRRLQTSSIAPVDLQQAMIGPGMAVFSKYAEVIEADGTPMQVRTALAIINKTLDEVLAEQEGDFDADSRWALAWFEQSGFAEGEYGMAETLSKAKNTSVRAWSRRASSSPGLARCACFGPTNCPPTGTRQRTRA